MFHHLTFPSALHFYIELHTHTHTCLVFLFERFTGADRSSLCCRSLWNRDNSVMRDSWEVRGPGRQSRNSLQVLNHHMGAKKGDNEQWVGWARMLFRNWKGRKYSMVNVYDHHNCESTWHQPCIQIYCTKKSLTTICFKPHFLHYGTWWYLQCNDTEPPPLLPIPPTEASKSWDPQGNIYVNSYFSFLCPKQNNFVFHMLITHSYQCLHFGSHLFQIISSALVSSLHIALNCMSLDFQLLKNSWTY